MDPNNPWPETSYSHWVEYSEYVETPYSERDIDALNERLRRYHNPSPDSDEAATQSPKQKPLSPENSCKYTLSHPDESDSSSGTTLAPNTPPEDLVVEDLVVLDTPDRPGYVEPEPSPGSIVRKRRRKFFDEPKEWVESEPQPHESESWVDVEPDLNFLITKKQ